MWHRLAELNPAVCSACLISSHSQTLDCWTDTVHLTVRHNQLIPQLRTQRLSSESEGDVLWSPLSAAPCLGDDFISIGSSSSSIVFVLKLEEGSGQRNP